MKTFLFNTKILRFIPGTVYYRHLLTLSLRQPKSLPNQLSSTPLTYTSLLASQTVIKRAFTINKRYLFVCLLAPCLYWGPNRSRLIVTWSFGHPVPGFVPSHSLPPFCFSLIVWCHYKTALSLYVSILFLFCLHAKVFIYSITWLRLAIYSRIITP